MALQVINPSYAPNRTPFYPQKEKEDWLDKLVKGLTIAEKATGAAVNVEDYLGKRQERLDKSEGIQASKDISQGELTDVAQRAVISSGSTISPLSRALQPLKDQARAEAEGVNIPQEQGKYASPLLEMAVGKDKASKFEQEQTSKFGVKQAEPSQGLLAGDAIKQGGEFDQDLKDLFKQFYQDKKKFVGYTDPTTLTDPNFDESMLENIDLNINPKGELILSGTGKDKIVGNVTSFDPQQYIGPNDIILRRGDQYFVVQNFEPKVKQNAMIAESNAKLAKIITPKGQKPDNTKIQNINELANTIITEQKEILKDPRINNLPKLAEAIEFIYNPSNNTGYGHVVSIFKLQDYLDSGVMKETELNILSHAASIGSFFTPNQLAILNKVGDKVASTFNIPREQLDRMTGAELKEFLDKVKNESTGFLEKKDIRDMQKVMMTLYKQERNNALSRYDEVMNRISPSLAFKIRAQGAESEKEVNLILRELYKTGRPPGVKSDEELNKIASQPLKSLGEATDEIKGTQYQNLNLDPVAQKKIDDNNARIMQLKKQKEDEKKGKKIK